MNYTLRHLLVMMNAKDEDLLCDWMGFKVTPKNPLTGHHIRKFEDGGEDEPENIAALTILAHRYLHEQIEIDSLDYYALINEEFNKINMSRDYPSSEQIELIKNILLQYEAEYYWNINRRIKKFYVNLKAVKYLPEGIAVRSPEGYRLLLSQGIDPVKKHKPNKYKGIRY